MKELGEEYSPESTTYSSFEIVFLIVALLILMILCLGMAEPYLTGRMHIGSFMSSLCTNLTNVP